MQDPKFTFQTFRSRGHDPSKINPRSAPGYFVYRSMGKKPEITAGKVAFEFWIEREQKYRLDKLSEETGAPMAELCRRAVRAYLEKAAAR